MRAIGEDVADEAVLLQAFPAISAGAAGVDDDSDTGDVTGLELRGLVADCGDAANDFMTRYHRIDGLAPLVARHVDVGVAYSGV